MSHIFHFYNSFASFDKAVKSSMTNCQRLAAFSLKKFLKSGTQKKSVILYKISRKSKIFRTNIE